MRMGYASKIMKASRLRCSAWRYRLIENKEQTGEKIIEVTARLLGKDYTGTVSDIAKPEFWASNNQKDIVRYFST